MARRPCGAVSPKQSSNVVAASAERWRKLDAKTHPFTRKVAEHLPGHDDREEFIAGVDLILAGVSRSL